ncbi:HNH endonuclease family protein [Halobacillus sp. B29]|uniref:HNH endonuclease family protein n=1 Tax=Halobacillus sp. B29 TaxID=3457432 RepID=UPI003FCE2391
MKDIEQISLFESSENAGGKGSKSTKVIDKEDIEEDIEEEFEEEFEEDDISTEGEDNDDGVFIIGRKIDFNRSERRIRDLKNDETDGLLDKQPYFQRNYVWSRQKASQLIESLLLNVPIPLIYTAEDKTTGIELVIDGQQRLTSTFNFMDGEFQLDGLKIFNELNGKTYSQLDKEFQLKISRYPLSVIKVSAESDEEVKFEIFERINSGSANLNDQELRNCVYRGSYNEFIKKMAKNKLLHSMMFNGRSTTRMADSETVLRFFSFHLNGVSNYQGSLKRFLNSHMKDNKVKFDKEKEVDRIKIFESYKKDFLKALHLTNTIFGENSFKTATIKNKKLVWGRPNKALFDLITTSFAQYSKHEIVPNSDAIREALINIMLNDPKFLPQDGTVSRTNVRYRFNIWNGELQSIINSKKNPRSFSYEIKEELFNKIPTCVYCKQRIHSIDDSVVDHHVPYWRGGETITENARLMHRFCNQVKSGK